MEGSSGPVTRLPQFASYFSDSLHVWPRGGGTPRPERGIPVRGTRTRDTHWGSPPPPSGGGEETIGIGEGNEVKKRLALFVLTVALGVLGFTAASVAVAATQTPPGTPPGQGDCQHGNSGKACGDDPQPDNGKDCQAHGNNGGVNEDHCAPVETTTEGTTTVGTTTQGTTTQGTTTTQVTTTQVTTTTETPGGQTTSSVTTTPDAGSTASGETTTATPASTSSDEDDTATDTSTTPNRVSAASSVATAAVAGKKHAVLGESADAPKPTRQPQEPPFTL
jgi:hypothetical protein